MKTRKLLTLTSAIVTVLLVGGIVNASAANWLGTHSLSWNDPLNWDSGSVPDAAGSVSAGIFMVGNGSTTFTATITNNVAGSPLEIVMGGYGSTARVDHLAGTLSTTNNGGWPPGWVLIGFGGNGNATYNLADTTTTGGTFTGYGTGSGTLNIVDGLFMGDPGGGGDGTGISTLNVNTTGALTMNYDFDLGTSGWNATMNLDAGACSSTNGHIWIPKGQGNNTNSTTSGILNQSGGTFDSHWDINVGSCESWESYTNLVGTVNLNGGTMTTHGPDFWDGRVRIGANGGTGTFNLNGGTLTTLHVLHEGTSGTSIFNFNGGTLKASGSYNVPYGAFFGGDPNYLADGRSLTAAYVQAGGAIIDTAGFDNYIGEALLTGTNITDGGLTKNGNGQLEMDGASTFTGPVVVNGGTLYANIGSAPNNRSFSFCSGITVNSNATLRASSQSLFGWDGSQAKPITVNVGGTATTENGDQTVGLVTLAGGTLASVNPDGYWGSWHFGRAASVKKLLVTSNSTVSAGHVGFTSGATIEVASGMTLNFIGFIGDGGGDGPTAVIKQGAGVLTLSGTNIYTGSTTVSNGTLQVNGSLSSGVVNVYGGTLSGTGTIGGATTVNSSVTLNPGAGNIGTLTFSGNVTLNATATNNFTVTANGVSNSVTVAGTLTPNNSVVRITSGAALTGFSTNTLFTYSSTVGGSFNPTPVFDMAPARFASIVDDGAGHINLVITNRAPTASNLSMGAVSGKAATMTVLGGKHAPTDPDGDAITLSGVNYTGGNGASVSTDGTNVTYTALATYAGSDSFTYTVTDAYGASSTATVSVSVVADSEGHNKLANPVNLGGGNFQLSFLGVPGDNYALDWTASLTPPITWTAQLTNVAATNGYLIYTNNQGGSPNYWRTRYVP